MFIAEVLFFLDELSGVVVGTLGEPFNRSDHGFSSLKVFIYNKVFYTKNIYFRKNMHVADGVSK